MSTIGYSSWAVDLAEVGPVYPFQGFEVPMVVIGIVFWLGWHIVQFKKESAELKAAKANFNKENALKAIDRY